jgi:hypothetical protein
LRVHLVSRAAIHAQRFEKLHQFARCQVAPGTRRNSLQHQWSKTYPSQANDFDPGNLHHSSHHVIETLVQYDPHDDAFARFPHQADFVWNDGAAVDLDPVTQHLELLVVRFLVGDDVIFLGQPKPRVHHPVRDITVVRKQDQSLGFAIEPTNRVDAFRNIDQVHHGPAAALILDRGDEPARLVEHEKSWPLPANRLAIDHDRVRIRIDPGPEHRDDLAVHGNAACDDHLLGGSARGNAPAGENALESLSRLGVFRCWCV